MEERCLVGQELLALNNVHIDLLGDHVEGISNIEGEGSTEYAPLELADK